MFKKSEIKNELAKISDFHIHSYDYIIDNFKKAMSDMDPLYTINNIKISVSDASIKPVTFPMTLRTHKKIINPSEARIRHSTYYCELHLQLCFENSLQEKEFCSRVFYVPLMVKSKLCFLSKCDEESLIKLKEDPNDPGGYFIVHGTERIYRLFIVPRRNYPLALEQNKWKSSAKQHTKFGLLIRSVKDELTTSNVTLHFCVDGNFDINLHFKNKKYLLNFMLVLKALVPYTDWCIINEILKFYNDETLKQYMMNMLRGLQQKNIFTQEMAKEYIGKSISNQINLPSSVSFSEITDFLFEKSLLVHLKSPEDKFNFLGFSVCKLYCLVQNKIVPDDLDNPVYQEILSPGFIFLTTLKIGVASFLNSVKNVVERASNTTSFCFQRDALLKYSNRAVSFQSQVATMIATGNLSGKTFGLYCNNGWTVLLKRNNIFGLIAQFKSLCRFSLLHYSNKMRKFYPESYGFLCPTYTPEGENTGLYNQLSMGSKIVNLSSSSIDPKHVLQSGVLPCNDPACYYQDKYFVLIDGLVYGWIPSTLVNWCILRLREMKSDEKIPFHSEVAIMEKESKFFPALYLFSTPCRLVRKILNLDNSRIEFIGCFEQVFKQVLKYSDIDKTSFLSLAAAMIPYFEFNPATRNIFSSVKCKQAIGLPCLNLTERSDSKSLQLVYLQSPIISTDIYWENFFETYPFGTNVTIAVLSYSGYDMEDALIINKSSVQNGLMHNVIYKTVCYALSDLCKENDCKISEIMLKRNPELSDILDDDGLPYVGSYVQFDQPILCLYNNKNKRWIIKKYKDTCSAYISCVKLSGELPSVNIMPLESKKVFITFCTLKVPVVGDKFSNRHGGKGVCGALVSKEDMPFSENGISPDILLNPHSLPSRMTVGMLLEMAASKVNISCTKKSPVIIHPFKCNKKVHRYEKLGQQLKKAGLEYYGTEKFYSGTSGIELEAEVYTGYLYYLRFHHLVEEKCQVRSTGPIDEKVHQPINPNRSGAIRFGEMERDAIMSHGAGELLLDRMLHNSDKCYAFVCKLCHEVLYPVLQHHIPEHRFVNLEENNFCQHCNSSDTYRIRIPYVLICLIAELSCVKIKIMFHNGQMTIS